MQEEDQLAIMHAGEKRDPNGTVQDDWVTAVATPCCVPTAKQSKSTRIRHSNQNHSLNDGNYRMAKGSSIKMGNVFTINKMPYL